MLCSETCTGSHIKATHGSRISGLKQLQDGIGSLTNIACTLKQQHITSLIMGAKKPGPLLTKSNTVTFMRLRLMPGRMPPVMSSNLRFIARQTSSFAADTCRQQRQGISCMYMLTWMVAGDVMAI